MRQPRSEGEILAVYRKIKARVDAQQRAGEMREGDGAWLEALKWALGSCLDPYHPPECNGTGAPCRVPPPRDP
jgi:hypothetical protein